MTATLDTIKIELDVLTAKIAQYEAQRARTTTITAAKIELREGETYAGLVLLENGAPSHHLILLPGDESLNWNDAVSWSVKIGGELPTRPEQALLYANCKKHFKDVWYWSATQHANGSDYAWVQYFGNGFQIIINKSASGRARAVRRLPI